MVCKSDKLNRFRYLLKEKVHQELRNYGISDEKAFDVVVKILLAKIYDEIRVSEKIDGVSVFHVRLEDYLDKSSFYSRIRKLFKEALLHFLKKAPEEVEAEEILVHEKKEEILLNLVSCLQEIKFKDLKFLSEDLFGDVFLDYMHSFYRQSKGLFFTHPNICKFVCKALNIQQVSASLKEKKGDYKRILDPSCGSGTFLIEAMRSVFGDYSVEDIKKDASMIFYGLDNELRAVTLCKVNMIIHGDGSANVYIGNALSPLSDLPFSFIKPSKIEKINGCTFESIKEGFGVDFIITNPPFSLAIKREDCNGFRMKDFVNFKNNVTYASECFFVERWFQLLNPGGKLGAVLPISLFDSNEYLKARLLFFCYFRLRAIVGLPEHAFAPHAQQRTVLVFAERRSLEESNKLFNKIHQIDEFLGEIQDEKIIFYDAKNIGYIRAKKRKTVNTTVIEENDLFDEIAEIIAKSFSGEHEQNPKIVIKTIKEISKDKNFVLTPDFVRDCISLDESKTINLYQDWELVEVEKIYDEVFNANNLLVCETGDIVSGGAGIIVPKNLNHTTSANRERIKRKIKMGKFGFLKEGDVIIAPVRIYQKKIAVVTKEATKFLFSKDFIVLRRKSLNLEESFSLFLSLISDENIRQLEKLSSTGKSGYPKIKNKSAILQTNFYKKAISTEKIKELMLLYEDIYKKIFGNI